MIPPPGLPPLPDDYEITIAAGVVWEFPTQREFPTQPSGFLAKILAEAPLPFTDAALGAVVAEAWRLHLAGKPVHPMTIRPGVKFPERLGALARNDASPHGIVEHCAKWLWLRYVGVELGEQLLSVHALSQGDPEVLPTLPVHIHAIADELSAALNPDR